MSSWIKEEKTFKIIIQKSQKLTLHTGRSYRQGGRKDSFWTAESIKEVQSEPEYSRGVKVCHEVY